MEHPYLVKSSSAYSGRHLKQNCKTTRCKTREPFGLVFHWNTTFGTGAGVWGSYAEALHHIWRKYMSPGLEIPKPPTVLTTLQRAHYTELLARHTKQWERNVYSQNTSSQFGKMCPPLPEGEGFSWRILALHTAQQSYVYLYSKKRKSGGPQKIGQKISPYVA